MNLPDPRIAFFDHRARVGDSEAAPASRLIERLDQLRATLPIGSGHEVLEVGCGGGRLAGWLAACVDPGRVTAVDFSTEMIEVARTRGVDAEFRRADVCVDKLGFERYDVAFCLNSFPHFRDPEAALRNLHEALMPEGSLLVLHLDSWENVNAFNAAMGEPIAHDLLPTPERWAELLPRTHFDVIELVEGADLFYLRAQKY